MNKLIKDKKSQDQLIEQQNKSFAEFAKKHNTIGFDINQQRVNELKNGIDRTLELSNTELSNVLKETVSNSNGLYCTTEINDIRDSTIYIVTVPTPIDKNNNPDLTPLFNLKNNPKVNKKYPITIICSLFVHFLAIFVHFLPKGLKLKTISPGVKI